MNLPIGANIKKLRSQKQITQKQLAVYLGVTEQAVSRWESGAGCPDIQLLPAIASFFSVSADTILGLDRTEREARLARIREEIRILGETGEDTEEEVEQARLWAAEFPGEEDVQEHLANELCRYTMWDERPKMGLLQEAEKIYCTLIETTAEPAYRERVLEKLTALYAVGFRDIVRTEAAADRLPGMKYCRESVKATVFSVWAREHGEREKLCHAQDYIERLTDSLGTMLINYVVQDIPNGQERWEEKIGYFEAILSLYRMVFGENMLFYHDRAAWLYRIIATYRVAQGKAEETLDCLEKMTDHAVREGEAKPGDPYTSVFTDLLQFPEPSEDFQTNVHNCAWYCLTKMSQDRYDPIRETDRFRALCSRLEAAAK